MSNLLAQTKHLQKNDIVKKNLAEYIWDDDDNDQNIDNNSFWHHKILKKIIRILHSSHKVKL